MNTNKVSRKELVRRSNCYESANSSAHLSNVMRGLADPSKSIIDKLLAVTGMSYEVMFSPVEFESVKTVSVTQYNELLCKYDELLDVADNLCDAYLRHRRDYHYELEEV